MNIQLNSDRHTCRRGSALTELIVAAGILVAAMSLVAACVAGAERMRRLQRQYDVAVDELSNQLERLSSLSSGELPQAFEELKPSPWVVERLPEARLSANRIDDGDGDRIELQLSWMRPGQPPPLVGVAWLRSAELGSTSDTEADAVAEPSNNLDAQGNLDAQSNAGRTDNE